MNQRDKEEDELAPLVVKTLKGDQVASRALFQAVGPIFLRAARATLGSSHPDFDDFMQVVSMRFYAALPSYRGDAKVRRFASKIAMHVTVDTIRARKALKRERTSERLTSEPPSADLDQIDHVRREELLNMIRDVVSEEQFDTFVLRVLFGHSIEEVGRMTGVPGNTVRSRMRLARARIRRAIEQNDKATRQALEGAPHG